VIFRSSPARGLAIAAVLPALAITALWLSASWIADKPVPLVPLARQLAAGALGAALGYGIAMWHRRNRRTWVRVSPAGLELAYRGVPIVLAWPDIEVARVRRRRLMPVLEIIPTDLYAVRVDLPSRDLPPIRQTALGPAFVMDLSDSRPGARALRGVLRGQPS
jgi:hypothetical protein